jgi:glycosyltransferase involved in cell wall biosynthesis
MKRVLRAMNVAIVGPIFSAGGISQVINVVTGTEEFNKAVKQLYKIHTSEFKDKNRLSEAITLMKALVRFISILLLKEVDIVHIHSSCYVSFYRKTLFLILSKILRKKVIFHLHSGTFYDFFYRARGINRIFINCVFSNSNRLVVLCDDWKSKLEEDYLLNNVEVISNPSSITSRFNSCPSIKEDGEVKILFMGFLMKSKGIFDLIDVAESLKELNTKFVVCGKGEEERKFLKEVSSRSLDNRIDFLGWVSGERKIETYEDADILFLPSYREGIPMVILEAISFGIPIVSTNISGILDVVDDGREGFLLQPGDIQGFAQRLEDLIRNAELRSELAKNSLERSKEFGRQRIARKWIDLYEELSAS